MSSYEVIELVSGNLAGYYPSLEQAMTALAEFRHAYGSAELVDYSLLEIREDGELGESWGDEALLEKVESFVKQQPSVPSPHK